jgi:hypothetical protein
LCLLKGFTLAGFFFILIKEIIIFIIKDDFLTI